MLEPHTGSLLVDYFEAFLRDHDIDAFRLHVRSRYTEGTIARLVGSPNVHSRRAAVLLARVFIAAPTAAGPSQPPRGAGSDWTAVRTWSKS